MPSNVVYSMVLPVLKLVTGAVVPDLKLELAIARQYTITVMVTQGTHETLPGWCCVCECSSRMAGMLLVP